MVDADHPIEPAAIARRGVNYYPDKEPDERIEHTSLINIRPGQGNRGMFIEDPSVRERVRAVTRELIDRGESEK